MSVFKKTMSVFDKKKSSFLSVVLFNIGTVSIIFILTAYIFWNDYVSRIAQAKQNVIFVANLVATQSREKIDNIEYLLLTIKREIKANHLDLEHPLNRDTNNYLRHVLLDYKHLMDVLIIDDTGKIIQWSGKGVPPNVIDRPYVDIHLNKETCTHLYVGEPLVSKVHEKLWFFSVSSPVFGDHGELKYITVAIVDINMFQEQLMANTFLPETTVMLTSSLGKVISSNPRNKKLIGWQSHLISKIDHNNEGSFVIDFDVDGKTEIYGFHRLAEHGITAFSNVPKQTVLESWYFRLMLGLLVLVCVVLLFTYLTIKNYRNHHKIIKQQQQLYGLANTDGLTGLFNRYSFIVKEKAEKNRAKRYQHFLSYIFLDIDFFKAINDTYGHACGDKVLTILADIITTICRSDDVICRYGGEEFIILLPETTQEEAVNLAERLRNEVENTAVVWTSSVLHITASFGVSCFNGRSEECWGANSIKQADEAMYQAKRTGKNRVCCYEKPYSE